MTRAPLPPLSPTEVERRERGDRLARLAARRPAPVDPGPLPPGPRVAGPHPGPTARPARTIRTGATTPGRRHAARGSRAAALALSVGATVGLAGWFRTHQPSAVDAGGTSSVATAAGATGPAGATASAPVVTSGTAPDGATTGLATGSGLADGQYTGAASSNRWGTVQVQVTVSGGDVTAVDILQYPDGEAKSVRINQRALPTLVQETLATQSAQVDTVSGATYTSHSYQASLQSALDQARAAASASA